MRFQARHDGLFLGVAPTGRQVFRPGAAFFETEDGQLRDIWVLGALDGLRAAFSGSAASTTAWILHRVELGGQAAPRALNASALRLTVLTALTALAVLGGLGGAPLWGALAAS